MSIGVPRDVALTAKVHKGKGCELCGGTGMKGRVAIHEVMVINDELRSAIMRIAPAMELKTIGMRNGMRTLRQNGLIKMLRGEMDALEVVSNTAADDDTDHSGHHAA